MNEVAIFEAATKKQTFALYACYRVDFRKVTISKAEASQLITDFNEGKKELPTKWANMFFTTDTYKVKTPKEFITTNKVYAIAKHSVAVAEKTIKTANKKAKGSAMFNHMTSNEVAIKLIAAIGAEFQLGSVISNDIDKTDSKKYLFLGSGCGFSFIKFDGRNKKVAKFVEESRSIKKKVEAYYMTLIDKNYLTKLEKSGNPIQAHFMQNLSYNTSYNYEVIHYLESLGFTKLTATSMLD
jgi:hypothetical protein